MRILFALPGLHRVDRGAEVAFISVATELARLGDEVTLIGSGPDRPGRPYRYIEGRSIARERFERVPKFPLFRTDTGWEEFTFLPSLLHAYDPAEYDLTVTCSYPFTNWALRRPVFGGRRPPHVFVTQNGDWPARSDSAEFRFFDCDGLVCTNPEFFERNSGRYRSALVANGVDLNRFTPGPPERSRFGLDESFHVALMVSALIPSKNVADGIRAVSSIPDLMLVVAGDGPLRDELHALAAELLPDRYRQMQVAPADMPALYRSADLFLHLSRDESFGNVFVEAMACGTPIVAYDLARTRWIVGTDACLADPSCPGSIAAQIPSAIAGRDVALKLTERARRFDWSKIGAQYREFFQQVVEAGRAANR